MLDLTDKTIKTIPSARLFSNLERSMENLAEDNQVRKEFLSAPPFPYDELSKQATEKRIKKALEDFWYFDKTYFPAEMYSGGYFEPCEMHEYIVEVSQKNGVFIIFGPRGHGKTVTAKKVLIWLLLKGKVRITGTYSATIDKARNILADIAILILENDRIVCDFAPKYKEYNSDKLQFRFNSGTDKRYRYVQAFSEGRSMRGYGRVFDRPEFIVGDDIEDSDSSMQEEPVEKRILKLQEAFSSLSEKNRTFLILGNDIDRKSALHRIKAEQEAGILVPSWSVASFAAWLVDEGKPLWASRYKAKSEAELKAILQARDEFDWQANFQQNPIPPEGIFFKRENICYWDKIPEDARGVIYCDPNLSYKGKGDTTAITPLLFSAETMNFYVPEVKCRSYSDSEKLLDDIFFMLQKYQIMAMGMDGHVSQESTWLNNIRLWSRLKGRPFPPIDFLRLDIDNLAKSVQMAWVNGQILFPPNLAKTPDGKSYLEQVVSFAGKKANKRDDAPDSLIGAFTFLHLRHYVRTGPNLLANPIITEKLTRF